MHKKYWKLLPNKIPTSGNIKNYLWKTSYKNTLKCIESLNRLISTKECKLLIKYYKVILRPIELYSEGF